MILFYKMYNCMLPHGYITLACLYGAPVGLLVNAVIQSASHLTAAQSYESRASGNVRIKHRNKEKDLHDLSDRDVAAGGLCFFKNPLSSLYGVVRKTKNSWRTSG